VRNEDLILRLGRIFAAYCFGLRSLLFSSPRPSFPTLRTQILQVKLVPFHFIIYNKIGKVAVYLDWEGVFYECTEVAFQRARVEERRVRSPDSTFVNESR
jgi:hypothetical protein